MLWHHAFFRFSFYVRWSALQRILPCILRHLQIYSIVIWAGPNVAFILQSAPALAFRRFCHFRLDLFTQAAGSCQRVCMSLALGVCLYRLCHTGLVLATSPFALDVRYWRLLPRHRCRFVLRLYRLSCCQKCGRCLIDRCVIREAVLVNAPRVLFNANNAIWFICLSHNLVISRFIHRFRAIRIHCEWWPV